MNDQSKPIAVIGQGIMGLSCAQRLLEAGFPVDIFSKDDFWKTTSTSAGAYWWPHRAYPEERVSIWSKETYNVFKKDKDDPNTGITFEKHLRFCFDPDDSAYVLHLVDEWEEVNGSDYGLDCAEVFLVTLPVIDVPTYMPFLKQKVQASGGRILIRDIKKFAELFTDYGLVINCSGIGARELANDNGVFPIRGQLVRVSPSPEISRSTRVYQKKDEMTLVLPRTSDIILGGTSQDNDWSLEVRDEDTRDILNRCRKVVPALENCEVLGATVGLRPGREVVRLELERTGDGNAVIHNYGHGGGGYTVAWGCANEVRDLAKEYLLK
jgi:D-amino-acid oxidase